MAKHWMTRVLRIYFMVLILLFSFSAAFQAQRVLPPPTSPGQSPSEFRAFDDTSRLPSGPRDTELLQNGGFETADTSASGTANWTDVNLLSLSKRVCNRVGHPTKPDKFVAHSGECAFQFFAEITNVRRVLKQVALPMGVANDTLTLTYWAEGAAVTGSFRVRLIVTYDDGIKEKLSLPASSGTFPYAQFSGTMTLDKPVTKTLVKLIAGGAGRIYVDDLSLMHAPFEFAPTANDDPFAVTLGTINTSHNVATNDNLANPVATVTSFGGGSLGGAVSDNVAGATVAIPGSGGVTVTLAANGALTVDATAATPGAYTFDYQLTNSAGFDTATVTLNIQEGPIANDDSFVMLVGSPLSGDLNNDNGSGADALGTPPAVLANFGGGSLGGSVTDNPGGATVAFAGGLLTVQTDGNFGLVSTTQTGLFTFEHRLTNAAASDDATVTIEIRKAPIAVDDGTYTVGTGQTLTITPADPNDLLDNDDRGFPPAVVASFGGGSLGGAVTNNGAGATVPLASGSLTVNADGSLTLSNPTAPGTYTFEYRLNNVVSFDDGLVTVQVQASPVANDDTLIMLAGSTFNADLLIDNGAGPDSPGVPVYNNLTFGGGNLGGLVTDNPAGSSVAFAGGTLTVNLNGTVSLVNPTLAGLYTFQYRLSSALPAFDDATVAFEVRRAPTAVDDGTYTMGTGQTLSITTADPNDLLDNDDRGFPLANLATFGGGSMGGTVADNTAAASVAFAGGSITVNADGSFAFTAPTLPGTHTFLYALVNGVGTSSATVTIEVQQSPVAVDDSINVAWAGGILFDLKGANGGSADDLGFPAANVTSIGGGSLGGTVTDITLPAFVSFAGGDLIVDANGVVAINHPMQLGIFTFNYRLTNPAGSDDATVTIVVRRVPIAVDDGTYTMGTGQTLTITTADPNDLLDNDDRGFPLANLATFGGGSMGGAVIDHAAGSPAIFAGGTLTVNGDGSFTLAAPSQPGSYTFLYRLQNALGFDDGTVTVSVYEAPVAQDDVFQFFYTVDQSAPNSLFANNGFGPDNLGFPSATIAFYGAGSLGGSVIDHAAGTSASLAGGTLTVNSNGTWSLTGAPFVPGVYTFQYFLQNLANSSVATVTLNIVRAPDAVDDLAFTVASGSSFNFVPPNDLLVNDDRGFPLANVVSYGGGNAGGDITTFAANTSTSNFPGYTPGSGFLQINAAGTGIFTPPMLPSPFCGEFDFAYRLANSIPASDDATIRVTVTCLPVANDDAFNVLVGTPLNGDLNDSNGGSGDALGFPVATLSTFGGGSLGGTVADNAAGASVALAGGTLTVNSDGTFSLTGTSLTGDYSFQYQLSSSLPASDLATVTIQVRETPVAVDDLTYVIGSGSTLTFMLANDLLTNDRVGYPVATVESFGGLDAGGTVTTNPAGTMLTPLGGDDGHLRIFANGTGTFEARTSPGRFCGSFIFQYRLSNGVSFDDANVSIAVACPPVARDDTFNSGFIPGVNGVGLTGDLNSDNGHGADSLSVPAATITSFTLGTVGTPVAFAGGTITVNADGTFTLVDADTPGTHTFNYTLSNLAGSSSALVTFVIDAPPQVFSNTPADAATLIPRDTNITIDFTEQVNIAAGGVTVNCGAGALAFAPSLPVAATDPLVVNPSADLPADTVCTVTVLSAGVTDSDINDAPNNLDGDNSGVEGGDFVFSFQTRPEAVDDAYTVTPHLTFDSSIPAFSVSDNDIPASVAITGFGATPGTANGTLPNGTNFVTAGGAGGRVVLNADGTFLYYPDRLDSNTLAFFFYTVTGGDTAQVTISIQNQELIWFVDNDPGTVVCTGANLGTQACPEDTLREITGHGLSSTPSIDTANDTIYVRNDGDDAPYLCGVPLESGEKIIGDGTSVVGETLASLSGVTPVSGSSLPAFSGVDPTFTDGAGSCLLINANNVMRGFTIGSTVSYALFSNVANIGTTSLRDVSIDGANGFWILGNAGTFNAEFNTLTSSGSNIAVLNGIGGTITNGVSSSVTTTTGTIFVTGSNPSWTYTGSITKTGNGRLVNINGTTGGTLSFPGILTQDVITPSSGILIDNQTGGTVSFGTINLGQTNPISGNGVTITDGSSTSAVNLGTLNLRQVGGTISVIITEYDGTVTSTAGTISSTNIQAININGPVGLTTLGMTLTSVSSNAGVNGISIQDTNGSFTVNGSGPAGTGGTISGTSGDGVSVTNAAGIDLRGMLIQNNLGNGVWATNTVGFDISNTDLINNGDNDVLDEANLHFEGVTGSVDFNNLEMADPVESNALIRLSSGSLNFTMINSLVRDTPTVSPGNNGLELYPSGTGSITASITNSDFLRNRANGIQVLTDGAGTFDVEVVGGDFNTNNIGINIAMNGSANTRFDISDTSMVGNVASPININLAAMSTAASSLVGTIDNNDIGSPAVIDSGSQTGPGLRIVSNGTGTLTVDITNNVIVQVKDNIGIQGLARDGDSTLNMTITGNSITHTSTLAPAETIHISSGAVSADTTHVCAQIGDNGGTVEPALKNTLNGSTADEIRVRNRFAGTTFSIEGLPSATADTTAVANFLVAQNLPAGIVATASVNANQFGTIANCPSAG